MQTKQKREHEARHSCSNVFSIFNKINKYPSIKRRKSDWEMKRVVVEFVSLHCYFLFCFVLYRESDSKSKKKTFASYIELISQSQYQYHKQSTNNRLWNVPTNTFVFTLNIHKKQRTHTLAQTKVIIHCKHKMQKLHFFLLLLLMFFFYTRKIKL